MSEVPQNPSSQLPVERTAKPRGLSSFIPSKLQSLFNKGRKTGSTLPTSIQTEPNSSSIHPDIEEGARYVLENELIEMVRTGNVAGIRVGIRQLGNAWEQAQKAAGATFELTPEGRQEVPGRVKKICVQHLSEGLARVYYVAGFGIRSGWEFSIKDEPKRVAELFQIANEFQIPVNYLPIQEGAQLTGNTPAVLITTPEQALSYMQEVIDRNLSQGIHGIIKILGSEVSQGLLKELPYYEQKIERWINIMEQRGWMVVDQPVSSIVEGETQPGLLPRQVNKAEVRQLIDQAVHDNLAKGARHISRMVEFQTESGWFNPLQTWGTPENIALYKEAGEKYGLTHSGGVTAGNSDTDPDMYFDPTELPKRVREAVQRRLPEGLKAIVERHLKNVKEGDVGQIKFSEKTLEQYIQLAEEYGVHINPDDLKKEMTTHITADNLRQGVQARLIAVRDALRKANYSGVSEYAREAEEFRRFAHEKGFDGQVDFSELDRYLKQTATQVPRLTEGAS